MCSPKKMPAQEPIPEAVPMPKRSDSSIQKASKDTRRLASGMHDDIKTTPRGLGSDVTTKKKRLLGQ